LFLAFGLLLHKNARSYVNAIVDGSRGCAGIILQFPLYAGIFSLTYESGMVDMIASWAAQLSSKTAFVSLNFFSAGLLNIFIPSGGGQWGVQGAVVLTAAQKLEISNGLSVMVVAYGDQWTNMLQPFWALALLEITQLKARDIIGYTVLVMCVSGVVFLGGLLLFSLLS